MKFKFHSYPQTLAPSIIERGINEPLLRDEIFCQLIKQTTENPNVLSMSLALKLMYLCLLSFRPTQKDLIEILKSHLASLTGGIITKFTTFDLAEDLAARCFELLSKPLPNFLAISQDESRMFYELSSEKLHVSVVLRESRKSEKKSKKEKYMDDVVVNVPKISSELARFLLHDDVNITADDLSNTLSHKLKIPFVGYIKLQNYPSRLHLPEDGLIDGNTNLIQLIELLKNYGAEKSTSWLLVCEDSGEELADDVSQMHNLVIHSLEDVLGAPPPVSPKHGDDLDDNDASAAQHSMFGGNKLKDEEILLKEELRRKAEEAEASRLEEIHRQDELAKTLKAEEHARALEDARKKKERMELEDRENLARQAAAEKLEQVKKLKERASKLRSRTGAASSNFGSSGDISSFREGGTLRSTRVKRPVRQLTRTLRN